MRVFITGASGYVGAHLVRALTKQHEVSALTRSEVRARELRQHFGARLLVGALQDVDALEARLRDHDVLIHNALVWDEAPTELEFEDTRLAIKLFEAAAKAGVKRVLLTSSLAVHRPFGCSPAARPQSMRETDALHPTDSYGAIKASNELFLSALAHMHGMHSQIVRVGPVVGAPAYEGAVFKSDPRFARLVEQAGRGVDIVVQRGEGRQFIAAHDVAETYAQLAVADGHETWICTAENFTTWQHIAERVVERMGSSSRVSVEGEVTPHAFETTKLARRLALRFKSHAAMHEHIAHIVRLHTI